MKPLLKWPLGYNRSLPDAHPPYLKVSSPHRFTDNRKQTKHVPVHMYSLPGSIQCVPLHHKGLSIVSIPFQNALICECSIRFTAPH
ncbi:unnamed protein product [Chondrus crispus]|uniref:Uncharacterized protein n=1 Tax=Chondrus crispus TaxID=2769 RepID=R7QHP6_CHOCR|nr:unnamed protein product [Chondrus crispus]CDF37298.1 unnamed protein product [Chondrus crispus]|eukprot:XP_005717117.1 unnamed protein product [Chondrus crispus]